MIFTLRIEQAIRFSIKTHEGDQKQKRKGKDVPYITHPLTVGLILAHAGASEDIVIAGLLHDTVEDCIPEARVTHEMIAENFGAHVAQLVASVTEDVEEYSWEKRKQAALVHIAHFSHDSIMLKSADIIANASETIADHAQIGDEVFSRFGAKKQRILEHYFNVIDALRRGWQESPLDHDLMIIDSKLRTIGGI